MKLTAFGLVVLALNTTTSSFNFDGVGIATVIGGSIYRYIDASVRPTLAVVFALTIIPTIILNQFEKIEHKYRWWDVTSPPFSEMGVFNAGTQIALISSCQKTQ